MKKIIVLATLCCAVLQVRAKVELGAPFSDNAVLQRGMKAPVWGKAEPNEKVSVTFAGQRLETSADADGNWRVCLQPMEASKIGRVLEAVAASGSARAGNVLVGEVWFASGQSNMDCPIWGRNPRYRDGNGALLIQMTKLSNIRYLRNHTQWNIAPIKPKKDGWHMMDTDNLARHSISAVAFYYARELYLALDVPIGIVDSTWGGTPIEPWIPRSGYDASKSKVIAELAALPLKENFNRTNDVFKSVTSAHKQPTVLWNAMVSAYAPMAMRGFIWYQGCSNWSGEGYCDKMHALYDGWAKEFDNPNLKLYFVQLAPYSSNWMSVVSEQNRFAAEEPNAAIAVTSDVGNFHDIHPNQKEIVAKRLAVHALKRDYGMEISEDDSPVLKSVRFENGAAHLSFDHATSWYVYSANRSLTPAFEVAGTNDVWVAAKLHNVDKEGTVTGVELVVSADDVKEPTQVRYMGKHQTAGTLYNQVALPLGAFEYK